jgi:hypothetical protein
MSSVVANVFIKDLSGATVVLADVPQRSSMRQLYEAVSARTGLPVPNMRLIFA